MKLNLNEKKVLKLLQNDPYISQKNLAQLMDLSRPTVANIISGLQEKGYILGKPYVLREEKYITCIGAANIDYTMKLQDKMYLGTSNPVISSKSYGGVIRNVAENLARLDNNISLMTLLGDDVSGDELLKTSQKIMETFAAEKVPNMGTGSYYSIIDQKGNMDVGFANMSINDLMDRSWILEHKRHLNLSSWIITDLNISIDAVETLIEYKRKAGLPLVIIGVSSPKMKNLPKDIKDIDLIICNKDETETYFKTAEEDMEKLCRLWIQSGVKRAIVTNGVNGSYYADKDNMNFQKAYIVDQENIIDVTGAGDAFSGAVIHSLISGISFEECVKVGAMSSSLTIQSPYTVNPKISINLIKKELDKYENI